MLDEARGRPFEDGRGPSRRDRVYSQAWCRRFDPAECRSKNAAGFQARCRETPHANRTVPGVSVTGSGVRIRIARKFRTRDARDVEDWLWPWRWRLPLCGDCVADVASQRIALVTCGR